MGPNRELAIDLGSTNLPNFFVLSDGPFRASTLNFDDLVVKQTKQYIVQCYVVSKKWRDKKKNIALAITIILYCK